MARAKGTTHKFPFVKQVGKTKEYGKWIQSAISKKNEGACSPMSKPSCTPRRKALAKRFKKGGDLHQ